MYNMIQSIYIIYDVFIYHFNNVYNLNFIIYYVHYDKHICLVLTEIIGTSYLIKYVAFKSTIFVICIKYCDMMSVILILPYCHFRQCSALIYLYILRGIHYCNIYWKLIK